MNTTRHGRTQTACAASLAALRALLCFALLALGLLALAPAARAQAPGAPTGLSGAAGSGQIALTWTAPTGSGLTYNLYRGTAAGGEAATAVRTGLSATSVTDSGLTNGTAYFYKVTAVSAGTEGARSNEASATPSADVPAAADWIKAVPGSATATVSWAAVPGATSYTLTRSGTALSPTGTSYSDSGLTNGTTYTYTVAAVNASGTGPSVSATTVPGSILLSPPAALTATPAAGDIQLAWSPVSGATTYNIYRGTAAGGEGSSPIAVRASPSLNDTSLTNGQTYYYKIASVNANGEGSLSAEVSATPGSLVTAAPAWAKALSGNGQVTLYWAPVAGAASYAITRAAGGTTVVLASGVAASPYTDATAANGTAYTYRLSGVIGDGAGLGVSVGATPSATSNALSAPVLNAPTAGSGQATLSWSAVSGASGYNIYRAGVAGGEGEGPVLWSVTGTGATDSGLTNTQTYYYKVAAYNAAGEGAKSAEQSVTLGTSLPPPATLTATAGNQSVTLSWSAVTNATSYTLTRSTDGATYSALVSGVTATTYTDSGLTNGTTYYYQVSSYSAANGTGGGRTASATPSATSGAPSAPTLNPPVAGNTQIGLSWSAVSGVTGYHVYRGTSAGGEAAAPAATVTTPAWTDSGLSNGTAYYYKVSAFSAAGEGALSAEGSATPSNRVPGMPQGLKAVAGNGQVSLSWAAVPGSGVTYTVTRSSGGSYATIASGLSSASYTDTGLTNGTLYTYYVGAVNASGQGAGAGVSAMPGSLALAAPMGPSLAPGSGQMTVSWGSVSGAVTYNLYRATTSGGEGSVPLVATTGTLRLDTGLSNGTTYYYQVAAVGANGEGALSAEASAVAGASVLPAPSGLAATAGYGQVNLSWTAQPEAGSYNVYRGSASWNTTLYQAGVSGGSFVDTGVTDGTLYYYQVAGVQGGSEGMHSSSASATPLASAAPGGLTATAGNTQVTLSWTASAGATSYNLYRGTSAGSEASVPVLTGVTDTSVADTGLSNGTTYFYKVAAVNPRGVGPQSGEVSATPAAPPTVVTAAAANPSPVTGTTTNLSVLGGESSPPGESGLTYTWTTTGTPPALVTFLPNGTNAAKNTTATFVQAGTYTFQVTIQNPIGEAVTSSVTVTVNQTPTAINVSPSRSGVSVGGNLQFSAEADDQFNLALPSQPTFSWSVSGGGTISTAGLFTAGSTAGGPFTVTVTAMSLSATATVSVAQAVLTQAQAIQIAQAFCQSIGAPVTASATAVFPAPPRYSSQQDTHWQTRWRIDFGTQADVEVVDATGIVSRYSNYALSQQLRTNQNAAGTPISEANAIQAAAAVVQAAGQTTELVSSPTTLNPQIAHPATQVGDLWEISWQRQFQNIPYWQQQATVILQAETGAVMVYSAVFHSPPPANPAGSVTSTQAQQTAQAQLNSANITGTTLTSTTLEVVQPNTFWQQGGSTVIPPNEAGQIAWDCIFQDANGGFYQIWVDSNSGGIIGGGEFYTLGYRKAPFPTRKTPLKRARAKKAKLLTAPKRTRPTQLGRKPL